MKAGAALTLDRARSTMFARVAIGHVTRTFPHKLDYIVTGPDDAPVSPDRLHPLFHGSFDWHSCVHGYWTLARLLTQFPRMASARTIRRLFDARITAEAVAGECAYFERPSSRGFERPYGWAWLLKLCAELHGAENPAWFETLQPLAELIVARFAGFLPLAVYPVRTGSHPNTAFALLLAADYATATGNHALFSLLRDKAIGWYGADRDCQAWEPGGDDFLSPALIEAGCMRRFLPRDAFMAWFDAFLPRLDQGEPAVLFRPAIVSDRTDGKLAHLDGLNLSRAWCFRLLSASFHDDDPRRRLTQSAAVAHLAAGLPHVVGDYMGEHWLASFALLAFESSGAAPETDGPDPR